MLRLWPKPNGALDAVTETFFMPPLAQALAPESFLTTAFTTEKRVLRRKGGHVGIDWNGPVCNCGKRGCIETLAAGPAIARRARQKLARNSNSILLEMAGGDIQKVSGQMVGRAHAEGDPVATEVMQETLDLLAYWLGSIIDLLEPDIIVIGGGVSSLLAPFLDEIRERWRGTCINPAPLSIPLVLAHYGEDAGITGAAALCD